MTYQLGRPLTRLTLVGAKNDLVDPGPVVEHIRRLLGVGMTRCMIARAAGVTEKTLTNILVAEWLQTRRGVADAILKVDGRPHRQQAQVLGIGTRRRIEGLAVIGWSMSAVGATVGISRPQIADSRLRPTISYETFRKIREAFDSLGPDGGDTRIKRWAAKNEFVHPLLWDDIDDPFAKPARLVNEKRAQVVDEVVVQRLVSGHKVDATKAERRAAFAVLNAQGLSCQQISAILGITDRTIERYRAQSCAA